MKKSSLLKLISLIFVCAMVIGAVAVTAFAAEQTETVEICKKNIEFGDKLRLQFALKAPENVDVSAVCNGEDVEIEYVENIELDGVEYRVYQTVEGWSAQNINTTVTVTATAGGEKDVLTYSVLMYLYERLNLDNLDPVKEADRIAMYEDLLSYAKSCDKVINSPANGRTPNELDKYRYVCVEGATLDGYNTWGMFKEGETPFANVEHTLEVGEGDDVAWYYSVDGGEAVEATLDEIKALTVDGEITVTAQLACTHPGVATVTATTEGSVNTYVYSCQECGEVVDTRKVEIGTEGINYYAAPSTRFHHNFKGTSSWGTTGNVQYDNENGVTYTRVPLSTWGEFEVLNGTEAAILNTPSQTLYGSGKYVVMKVRVGSGVTSSLNFAAVDGKGTVQTFNSNLCNSNGRTVWVDGEWAVYVIDMSQFFVQDAYNINNTEETKAIFAFQDRGNGGAEAYVDFAYFAVCDSWNEIRNVAGDDNVILTNYRDNNVTKQTVEEASGCTGHKYGYFKPSTAGASYVYGCTVCGYTESDRFEISSEGVNYFAAPSTRFHHNFKGTSSWGTTGNVKYDEENDVTYTRVPLSTWGEFEVLNGTEAAILNTPSQTLYGSGKYVVMKVRVGSGVTSSLNFAVVDGKGTVQTLNSNLYNSNGRTVWVDGEWAVYVIDMSAFFVQDAYNINNTEETKAIFAFQDRGNGGSEAYVDFAYFAVCDSWAEIDAVVTDEQVIVTNWRDNNVEKTNLADYND